MIKLLAVGIWAVLVALGSSYVAMSMTGGGEAHEEEKEPTYYAGLDYRSTNPITVPMIADEKIKGYIIARFVYTIDGTVADKLAVPPEPFVLDAAFRRLYASEDFDFDNPARYDLPSLLGAIKTAVNERYGDTMIHEVLIQQFDYIAKGQVRSGT
ncbi:hypothetical protein DYI37_15520 [Fulvimarina endophytica]|uniref:Flagellar basal body-associated protein FliL n=1 Tax=Fulvimarina endophytica TaxID=2293836 RepID=A0A371X073_9HYPH|nr:hypothetical protein [Fulvimarina endophytica]RFC62641.1 hypothetical protein DYI37_15520 [Fulvimarina endophytica]